MPEKNKQEKIIEDLTKVADGVISDLGLLLVSIAILHQGKRRILNIAIHRKGGRVSLDDCEAVSRKLEAVLDDQSETEIGRAMEGGYVLDVESPGIDRVLKTDNEFHVFEGETVEVRMKESIDGLPHNIKGTLVRLQGSDNEKNVLIKNPSSLENEKASKSNKGKSKQQDEATSSNLKEEVALPMTSIYSVRLYPEQAIKTLEAPEADAEDDLEFELEA